MNQPDLFAGHPMILWLSDCGGWIYNVSRMVRLLFWLQRDSALPEPEAWHTMPGFAPVPVRSGRNWFSGLDWNRDPRFESPPITDAEIEALSREWCECPQPGSCDRCGWQPTPEALHVAPPAVAELRSELLC